MPSQAKIVSPRLTASTTAISQAAASWVGVASPGTWAKEHEVELHDDEGQHIDAGDDRTSSSVGAQGRAASFSGVP